MSSFKYPVSRVSGRLIFYFVSLNDHGSNPVLKIITYEPVDRYGVRYYNLGFGDYGNDIGLLDDKVISNNGDMRKVLETVVSTLKFFFQEHPEKIVHIEGSDQTRKDYYHKLIN